MPLHAALDGAGTRNAPRDRTSVRVRAHVLLALALATVGAVRAAPLLLLGVPDDERAAYRFSGADGRSYPYLGDFDSYVWLRNARNVLATGTSCDAVVDGRCLDRLAPAPTGGEMRYARSLHIAAIVALHRVLAMLRPGIPLEASAALVPLVVGTFGVLPAFALGRRLGGPVGGPVAGFVTALASALGPLVLTRSIGSDNDVWNVVLPLALAWAATRATASRTVGSAFGWAGLAGALTALHAVTWRGWVLTYAIVAAGVYRWLLTAPDVGRRALIALLALPPIAILAAETWRTRGRDAADRTAALVTVVWFLTTLLLAFDGLRFVMLLAPPCALAAGAAVGRLHASLARAPGGLACAPGGRGLAGRVRGTRWTVGLDRLAGGARVPPGDGGRLVGRPVANP